jgi:hypothetical protein
MWVLVVVGVGGMASGFAAPSASADRGVHTLLASLADDVERFEAETGDYPVRGPRTLTGTPVPDPWGGAVRYYRLPGHTGFMLVSLGADGRPGGAGEDADVVVYRSQR